VKNVFCTPCVSKCSEN